MNIKDLIFEDVGLYDLTTLGLNISDLQGSMSFSAKDDCIVSGIKYVKEILKELDIEYEVFIDDGLRAKKGEVILKSYSKASNLHKAWKISQNIVEYSSGIATYISQMLYLAKEVNPYIEIATTRKNFPNTKELMINAVLDGGGIVHRLGLYDSILVFQNHLNFIKKEDLQSAFFNLKNKNIEKNVVVEVDSLENALFFAKLGADILQCEKMSIDELKKCVELKKELPTLKLSATGGITLDNIKEYSASGVDFIVTSSPYHAKPADIKISMEYV